MVKAQFRKAQSSARSGQGFSLFRIRVSRVFGSLALLLGVIYSRMFFRLSANSRELLEPGSKIDPTSAGTQRNVLSSDPITIGYFVSVTGCDSSAPIVDGAAVLKHSIHLASIRGKLGGRYDYKLHAIYHPNAASCVLPLAKLGYELVRRDTPVAVEDIKGEFLKKRISGNGCCGEAELIKLEAYTFTEYPVVVHVDLDVIILKPLDSLFDAMIGNNNGGGAADPFSTIERMWPDQPIPSKVNAFFTRDYGVVNWNIKHKAVQGGFLVLRPDKAVYDEYIAIVKEGDFQEGKGWGGKVGPFYGAMTVQGLLPYYYDILHPGQTVDLNNCVYNNMCNNPTDEPTVKEVLHGKCRSGASDCEDCRRRPMADIVSTHFTICQKPWFCLPYGHDIVEHRLCRKVVREWYRIRSDLEKSWGRSGMGPGNWRESSTFYGYCTEVGKAGYVPIEQPYGQVAANQ